MGAARTRPPPPPRRPANREQIEKHPLLAGGKAAQSNHFRLSQAVSSDNGPNGVNQPTARHSGNIANTANTATRRAAIASPVPLRHRQISRAPLGAMAVTLPLTMQPLASAHFRRLLPPLPCPRHGPG